MQCKNKIEDSLILYCTEQFYTHSITSEGSVQTGAKSVVKKGKSTNTFLYARPQIYRPQPRKHSD